jgi:hypothetical protein
LKTACEAETRTQYLKYGSILGELDDNRASARRQWGKSMSLAAIGAVGLIMFVGVLVGIKLRFD